MKRVIYVLILITSTFILSNSINAWSEYTVGQEVEYNGINFYVIKDSGTNEDSVTMLKAEQLTVEEVNLYGGVGTANNHVNMYVTSDTTASYYQTAFNYNGYGGMAYYSSATCGYSTSEGCTTDYAQSEVKYVVDAWAAAKVPSGLQSSRLITIDDLEDNLGYEQDPSVATQKVPNPTNTPSWVYSNDYWYWTGSQYEDSASYVWGVGIGGPVGASNVYNNYGGVVRPVIVISKSALGDTDNSKEVVPDKQENKKSETSTKVTVANTYLKTSTIVIMLGFIIAGIGIFIFYKLSNKKK